MPTTLETRFLIVGAGATGLAFADWLEGEDYLVVERESEPGGWCRTVVQDGFIWDYSGHFFHFRHPEVERYLIGRMEGQRIRTIRKSAKILFAGGLVDFPFQKNIHQLPREDFIDCLVDLYFKAEDYPPDGPPASFGELLYQRFGRGITERFLRPYNEKLYATGLGRLDVDAMGRFFPWADTDAIIRHFREPDPASYNATFTYPEGGAIQYIHALLEGVEADRILYDAPLRSIDLERREARTDEHLIRFEHLISSAPFPRLLELTGAVPDPEIYTWNQVLVFNMGFDKKGPEDLHWCYVPEPDLVFYRVGFYDNMFETERLSAYIEIGLPQDHRVTPELVEEMRQRTLVDLRRAGFTSDHELESWHTVTMNPAYVHITQRSVAEVARETGRLATSGVHSIGRYGSWTYCSIEDNILEARALAEALDPATRARVEGR